MKENPNCWGDAVLAAVENLTDEKPQLDFLRWLSDPKGRHREANAKCPIQKATHTLNLDNFTVEHGDPGKYPAYKLSVTQNSLIGKANGQSFMDPARQSGICSQEEKQPEL
jgi:hypothetical protein